MSPLIEMVTEWEAFSSVQKNATLEAFCHHYIDKKKKKTVKTSGPSQAFELARLTGRMASIQRAYQKISLKSMPDMEIEWYYLLYTINRHTSIRKTDVLGFNYLLEPSTGIDIINRMIKAGLLREKVDTQDKRARLISITNEGKKLLHKADRLIQKTMAHIFDSIDITEQQSLINILGKLEHKHSNLLIKHKHKTIDEIISISNNL